jgi:hypothetical protein
MLIKPRIHQGVRTLSIMPTYPCTAASSPGAREHLPRQVMMDAIVEAKALGFRHVVLTADEPTLRWRDILECITYATSLGMSTRVVSNASWAVSLQRAGQWLDVLMEHGLSEIEYATGDDHARVVPLERIVHAIAAALDRELPVHVMVELGRERRITRTMLLEHPMVLMRTEWAEALLEITESDWMPLDHDRIEPYPPGTATDADADAESPAWLEELHIPEAKADAYMPEREGA